MVSFVLSAIVLFGVGWYSAVTLIGDWRKSGLQFVAIGIGAALLGYAISSVVSMFAGGKVAP